MRFSKIIPFLFLFLFSLSVFGQTTADPVKEKLRRENKLLEQILGDAKQLRLPENRAYIFARVAAAYWKTDEKMARRLFSDAADDLIAAQTEVINEKNGRQYFQALIYGQSPRLEIINLIGARDAEWALELLAKTRPPLIAKALNEFSGVVQTTPQQYANTEITAEQRLIALAAEQNPEAAVKRIRESLKKGPTYEIINLLHKIYAKEPETAEKLVVEIGRSFLEKDLSKNQQTAEVIGYFINDLGREKPAGEKSLSAPDDLIRELAQKLTEHWLDPKTTQFYGYWNCYAIIEKKYPEKFARIKQKQEKINNQYQTEEGLQYTKLTQSDVSADEMLARAADFSPAYRNEIYRMAADKYAQNGNLALAEKIITGNISEDDSDRYVSQFYASLANQAVSQGNFETAAGYADRIPDDNQRISALINLATQLFQKNPEENRPAALRVLEKARLSVPAAPETQEDLSAVVNLASAYSAIDPNESFGLIETLIPALNELGQATFVMAKFRSYGGYRQGELQIAGAYYPGVYNLESILKTLQTKDFERALRFTDAFERIEMRIKLRLQLIDESLATGGNLSELPINSRRFSIDD